MPQQHKTGPLAILEALRGLDLDKIEQEAQEGIRSGTKTARAGYVKRLNAVRGLRRTGVAPAELMVTSVPVIPPKFRPFAQQGDTLIAGDANILYKDFIEQNEAFNREREMFGGENAGQGRLDLYDTAKALYGYGDPVKEKTRQKDVRGFLKKVTGRTSKTGYFQSRMISKTQDSVGRSTIIVDPELGMDEIGLPRDMAMTMYAPHVQRRLRQTGMADSDALKAVRDRAPVAMHALEREVEVRPVVYSRAPAWYQHNIIGGNVKLVDGDAISISPAVTTGLNADFDGDQEIGCGLIALDFEAIKEILPDFYEKYKDCALQSLNPAVTCGRSDEEDQAMFNSIKTAINDGRSVVAVDFEDFPHTGLSNVRKDDKYDIEFYNVPEGIHVAAYDERSRSVVWAPVKYWSIHRGKAVEIVNLDDGSQIYTDDDPRAVYGIARDADTLVPQRFTPTEAVKRGVVVPQDAVSLCRLVDEGPVKYFNFKTAQLQDTDDGDLTVPVDFELGQLLGVMAGDGWCDKDANRGTFIIADNEGYNAGYVADYLTRNNLVKNLYTSVCEFKKNEHPDRYGDTTRHAFYGKGHRIVRDAIAATVGGERDERTSGSGNKRWPLWYRHAGSAFIKGFASGLVATDGSVSLSVKPERSHDQLLVQITSTSLRMLRETKDALRLIGISSSITFSKKTLADNDAWLLNVSTTGAKRENLLGNCCNKRKAEVFNNAVVDMGATSVKGMYTAFPRCVASIVHEGTVSYKTTDAYFAAHPEIPADEVAYRKLAGGRTQSAYKDEKAGYCTKAAAAGMLEVVRWEDERRAASYAKGVQALEELERNAGSGGKELYEAVTQAVYSIYPASNAKDPGRLVLVNSAKYRKGKKMPAAAVARLKAAFSSSGPCAYSDHPVLAEWRKMIESPVNWRYIESVEKTGRVETGYDLTVPGYETFMNTEGVILSNTINVHVPASDDAVKETYEALMPSAHPYDDRSGDTIKPKLKQEQVLGLYDIATRPASGTYRFATTSEALKAVREGAVPLDADLEVGDLKPVEKRASLVGFINNKAKDIAMAPVSGIMNMELPHSVDSDGDGVPDDITPEEAGDMLRELYGIDIPEADAQTLRDVQGIVGWLKARREGEKAASYVDPSMDMGERGVSGEALKALEMMYGVSFPDVMRGGARAVDVARYLARELKRRAGLDKEAGRMMEVAFENLEQSGEIREKRRGGVVYMPDCDEYRGILSGDDREAKAKLVQKFVLNQAPGVVYAACDACVVEK